MANIIIIEDDTKVKDQFHSCFKELGGKHRFRFFATSEEFQDVYLKNAAQESEDLPRHPLFQSFSKEQMDWILSIELMPTSPFAESAAKAMINKEGKIIAFDDETTKGGLAFDKTLKEISQMEGLTELISNEFHPLWRSFYRNLSEKKVISTALPFTNEAGSTWLLKVSAKKNNKGATEVVFRHQPDVFKPILLTKGQLQQSEATGGSEELQLLSTIHMVIFRVHNVQSNIHEWIDSIEEKIKEFNYNPEEFRVRFVATMFEETEESKLQLMHPQLDDIIYLPLDRLIFMQKMEIILNFPSKANPSFLFMAQEEISIELSKRTFIERISEVGCAIRLPDPPLQPEVLSRFKFRLPSAKANMITTLARPFHSTDHPEIIDEQLVYFYFFGMKKEDMKALSTYLNSLNSYKGLKDVESENFEYNPDNQFLPDHEKETKYVMILDVDLDVANSLASLIRESINQVEVRTGSSYYLFLRNCLKELFQEDEQAKDPEAEGLETEELEAGGPEAEELEAEELVEAGGLKAEELEAEELNTEDLEPKNAEDSKTQPLAQSAKEPAASPGEIPLAKPEDLFAENISWIIARDTFEYKKALTPPKAGDHILDHDARVFFIPGTSWQKLFLGRDNAQLLEESLKIVSHSGKKVRRKFSLLDKNGSPKWVQAIFSTHHNPNEVMVTLKTLEEPSWKREEDKELERLDMLIISEEMLPENVNSWQRGITEKVAKAGLIHEDHKLNIVVLSDKVSNNRMQIYRHSQLDGLHLKPLHVRAFLFELTVLLQAPFSKHNFENQTWVESHMPVHITKEVMLEGISEFGATLTYHTNIQPGTILYLHENVFDSAPNNCLAARFYHSEEHSTEKDMFSCSFLYYGITDAFLKHCRAWVRENYAAKKAKELNSSGLNT